VHRGFRGGNADERQDDGNGYGLHLVCVSIVARSAGSRGGAGESVRPRSAQMKSGTHAMHASPRLPESDPDCPAQDPVLTASIPPGRASCPRS
jgi:hypothetical protein